MKKTNKFSLAPARQVPSLKGVTVNATKQWGGAYLK